MCPVGFQTNAPDPAPLRATELYALDAYGHAAHVGTNANNGSNFNPILYGGQHGYYREASGFYQLGHRYYQINQGRFLTRDPIGYKGGLNLYGFVGNNPVNRSDPSGYAAPEPAKEGNNDDEGEASLLQILIDTREEEKEKEREAKEKQAGETGAGAVIELRGELRKARARNSPIQRAKKTQTLKQILQDNPALLGEVENMYKTSPEWQGIDPEKTPVFYRNKDEVDIIRAKPGERGGHHPHGLALGGPEGQALTRTNETLRVKNPLHSAATGLQTKIINIIKKK